MAIPVNELKYWDNGTPYGGVQGQENTSNTLGEMKYWDNGFPYIYIFPTASVTPPATTTSAQKHTLLFMGVG